MNKINVILLWIIAVIVYHITKFVIFLDRKFGFKMSFPRDVEALKKSQDWYVKILKEGNHIPRDCEIVDYKVSHLTVEHNFRSDAGIIDLEFKFEGNSSHFKCMAKFSPILGSIANRAIFNLQQNAQKEVGFYKNVAKLLNKTAAVPKSYFAEYHALTGNMCILIEFLEDYHDYSEVEGCREEQIAPTVSQMAALHASCWNVEDKTIENVTILTKPITDFFESICWYNKWTKTDRYILRTSWAKMDVAQTIIHGDLRVGNFMYHKTDFNKVQIIDFQAVRMCKGVFDLSFFLMLSLPVETRRSHETDMIQYYHKCLMESGVSDYSLEELEEDYKHASIMVLTMLALPLMSIEVSTDESSDAFFLVVFGYNLWKNRLATKMKEFDYEWMSKAYGLSVEECENSIQKILSYFESQYMVLFNNQFQSKELADAKFQEVKGRIEKFYKEKGIEIESL